MLGRRDLLNRSAAAAGALAWGSMSSATRAQAGSGFVSQRPPVAERRFVSPAVEREIDRVQAMIADTKLCWMFANCYPNTLDTTVFTGEVDGKPDSFVITGDIPAMWLRDSAAQLHPYRHLLRQDPGLVALFRGLIHRHARSILIDPYANAFMRDPTAMTTLDWAQHDETEMRPGVAERKWEIDSLCYAVRLAHGYWRETGDLTPFDPEWRESAAAIVRTLSEQRQPEGTRDPYRFQRKSDQPTETRLWGKGNPTRAIGLIRSDFRPSDDATLFSFLIPSNHFAVLALAQLAELLDATGRDAPLAGRARKLSRDVAAALRTHGTMRLPDGREVWAYEVDGYGNRMFMDDANVPSLLGLAYLGCVPAADPLWRRTAQAVWSEANPWFFRGTAAEGVGGPHVGRGHIWPMSIIVRALSSTDPALLRNALATLVKTDAGTGFMHEAFAADDPTDFTRAWFAWANGLFGELVLHIARTNPVILKEPIR